MLMSQGVPPVPPCASQQTGPQPSTSHGVRLHPTGQHHAPCRLLRRVAAAGAGGLSLDALLAAVAGGGRLALVGGRVVLGGAPALA